MPATLTYPGVYIEEIPSGVRTITGVATSITAFIGRTLRGPVNEPTTVNNFSEFERLFGGLAPDYTVAYAVQDFFGNGGAQAIIVRLYKPFFPDDATRAAALAAATAEAQTAANAISAAAATAAGLGGATPASVAAAASAQVATAGVPGKAALLAAQQVAAAAQTESTKPPYMTTAQRMDISGSPTGGTIKLTFGGAETAAIPLATLTNATAATAENALKSALEGLATIGAGNIASVVRSGVTPNFSFLISFGGTLAGPQSLITLSNNSLTGGASPTVTISLATIGVDPAGKAADSQPLLGPDFNGSPNNKTGLFALDKANLFNLLCIPPDKRDADTDPTVYQKAMDYCNSRRAMLIVDSPSVWSANPDTAAATAINGLSGLGLNGPAARNAALFFPRIKESDPMRDGQIDTFVPCGAIAGIFARTDSNRGVWKAPAGLDAAINGIASLQVNLADGENGQLNPLGINSLRSFPVAGQVVWGARTLRGADSIGDEYKYIPVRRTALYIEETLYRGTQWAVFEPNDEPLWAQIRLNLGAFMHGLFRQGAFQGMTPRDAYFVKCDKETTTQADINLGIVNIVVGFAPLKPAEFVVIKIQQMAGQIET